MSIARLRTALLASLALQLIGVGYISFLLPTLANSIGYINAIVVVVLFLVGVSKVGRTIVDRTLAHLGAADRRELEPGSHDSV